MSIRCSIFKDKCARCKFCTEVIGIEEDIEEDTKKFVETVFKYTKKI